jgi:hypothetical protein
MFAPLERSTIDDHVRGLLSSPYRLIIEELGPVIAGGSITKNRQTRIEALRTKATYWHEYASGLSLSDDHEFSAATRTISAPALVDRLMDANSCFLLATPKSKRAAVVAGYLDDLGEGTEFIFGSSDSTRNYLRAFHVETNRGPACFIDAVEGGVISWKRTEDWERAGRTAELLYTIAAVPSITHPDENYVVFGEDEASQIASALGHRKPTIFPNGSERKNTEGLPSHRLHKPDRSWRLVPRAHFSPLGSDEIATFQNEVLAYLETATCERTARVVSGAYAHVMRSLVPR